MVSGLLTSYAAALVAFGDTSQDAIDAETSTERHPGSLRGERRPRPPGVRSTAMDAQTVANELDRLQLVDVRYESEWQVGHIDGAVNVPEEDLAERVDELDRSRPVVTVCRAGTRSSEAAEWLRGQGFDAQSLDGGMLSWKWAGQPITGGIVQPDPRPELSSPEMQKSHNEFLEIALAVQERFGVGVQPSEEEIKGFLRERLIGEGRTPEEADTFLAEMGGE